MAPLVATGLQRRTDSSKRRMLSCMPVFVTFKQVSVVLMFAWPSSSFT